MVTARPCLILSQIGCSDPFGDAQRANTVEAYEQFIKEMESPHEYLRPNSPLSDHGGKGTCESQKIEDFDAYLKKFKKNPPSKKPTQT